MELLMSCVTAYEGMAGCVGCGGVDTSCFDATLGGVRGGIVAGLTATRKSGAQAGLVTP